MFTKPKQAAKLVMNTVKNQNENKKKHKFLSNGRF